MTIDQRDKLSDVQSRIDFLRGVLELFTEPFVRITDPHALAIEAASKGQTWASVSCLIMALIHELAEYLDAALADIDGKEAIT